MLPIQEPVSLRSILWRYCPGSLSPDYGYSVFYDKYRKKRKTGLFIFAILTFPRNVINWGGKDKNMRCEI